ncbi:MAG: CobW family GTP-binding protein [Thermoleophilia bacterium]
MTSFSAAAPLPNSMNVLVFAGFLGSGKTTLILALATQLAAAGRRTCFIVNEVGEVGIDQQVMRDGGLEVYEITAGCICCQLTIDLVTTLKEIGGRFQPDVVIVEASGVATPAGILGALSHYTGPPLAGIRTVTVVDPTRIEPLLAVMTPLIESQIQGADEIVITKADEATPDEVEVARQAAKRLRPEAPVHVVSTHDAEHLAQTLRALAPSTRP